LNKCLPKVLIVDDSANIRKLITVVLGRDKYVFFEAGDGEKALKLAITERPDLVILDIIIPRIDGIKVCETIKISPETKDMPVIILTSNLSEELKQKALKAGADKYMTKPFEPQNFRYAVSELLKTE
jgi:DNA-binding response OmpR family regulator